MGLRVIAEADLAVLLEDGVHGFGFPITLTDPNGNVKPFTGYTNDISQTVDPDTGQAIIGKVVNVALRLSKIFDAGMTLPQGIADNNSDPWVVTFDDLKGDTSTFKVFDSAPDRTLGIIVLHLSEYKV